MASKRQKNIEKPQLRIEYWPVSRLKPYERNPRKNDKAVIRMQQSIAEYGFAVPVLAQSDGTVVDGHLRLKGAIASKLAEVPVIPCDGWTADQVKAFRLMANRSVAWADWDLEALALEFGDLKTSGFDLSLTGFDSREIDGFTLQANATEDDVPSVPEAPVTKPGDLWILGDHRVMCGDATSADDVAKLLGKVKPALMVTDPPYGVNYDPKWRLNSGINKAHQKRAEGLVSNDDRADWKEAWLLSPSGVAYVWHGGLHSSLVANSLISANFSIRSQIIWAKGSLVIGRGNYHWQHEPCWYAVRQTAGWSGDRKQSTLWKIENMHVSQGNTDDGKNFHSTQKPVECMRRPMVNHNAPEVYDPFLGSGTTLIAAETVGRACYGMEIEPAYADIIVKRWENLTGKRAVLESAT